MIVFYSEVSLQFFILQKICSPCYTLLINPASQHTMGIKENYVFDKHPYRISKQKSGRWKTYIKDDLKGRKAIERNEKKDLIDFLYNHYYAEEKTAQSMTAVFEAFLDINLTARTEAPRPASVFATLTRSSLKTHSEKERCPSSQRVS